MAFPQTYPWSDSNNWAVTEHYNLKKPKKTAVVNIDDINDTIDAIDQILIDSVGVINNIIKKIYPVGAIYITAKNENPNITLGFGTWERIGGGRCLIDANSTYTAGSTGGSATHTHSTANCTLTAAQCGVPAHSHSIPAHGHGNNISFSVNSSGYVANGITGGSHNHDIDTNGGGGASPRTASGVDYTYSSNTRRYSTFNYASTHTHNLPNHTHTLTKSGSVTNCAAFNSSNNTAANASAAHNHGTTGSGSSMQPYLAVYIWKRTA